MGETIELTAADGHRLSAYLAEPAAAARGGLVVIQEIFGVNRHIRALADGFAGDGWRVLAPALFDRVERGVELGYEGADIERGRGLKGAVAETDALADIVAAVAGAAAAGRVGVVGYCWGGLLAWLAACGVDGLSGAVCYYGGGIPDRADLTPRCPVLMHFGEQDQAIPMAGVRRFMAAHPDLTIHTYPAGHGFNCDMRGSYHKPSAVQARQRTVEFLSRQVGGAAA